MLEASLSDLPFVLGLGGLHRLATPWKRQALLSEALAVGFQHFDVAPAYGNGLDEVELGLALRGRRHEFSIATKYGIPMPLYGAWGRPIFPLLRAADKLVNPAYRKRYQRRDFRSTEAVKSLEGSLKRLKTDYVDVFFIHEPVAPLPVEQFDEIVQMAGQLKREGKIRAFGLAGGLGFVKDAAASPFIDVLQLPLAESSQETLTGKITIAYGVYSEYRKIATPSSSFVSFVKTLQQEQPDLRLILSTTKLSTLATFGELFR